MLQTRQRGGTASEERKVFSYISAKEYTELLGRTGVTVLPTRLYMNEKRRKMIFSTFFLTLPPPLFRIF